MMKLYTAALLIAGSYGTATAAPCTMEDYANSLNSLGNCSGTLAADYAKIILNGTALECEKTSGIFNKFTTCSLIISSVFFLIICKHTLPSIISRTRRARASSRRAALLLT